MTRNLTIVMYHYVRDLERSRYPQIKGLTLDRFRDQLEHIDAHYTHVTVEDVVEALSNQQATLPRNAILLTFDDGFTDHFVNVFPLLDARGVLGCFFPPAQAILDHKVCDVHKIHFTLAAVPNAELLLDRVFRLLPEFSDREDVEGREFYWNLSIEKHRYDAPQVTLLKRLLQRELPPPVREVIVDRLFAEFVTADESAFAAELYMSVDQLQCMARHGMHIGGHGHRHVWLNHLAPAEQALEIDLSVRLLDLLDQPRAEWTMCYPFGGYDDCTLTILKQRHCRLGFSVEARVADLDKDSYLTLPRIDTNDLPV